MNKYHPWFLRAWEKNCPTKPIPRINIRFGDFGSDESVSESELLATGIRGQNGVVCDLGRQKFLRTWLNSNGVTENRYGVWQISIAKMSVTSKWQLTKHWFLCCSVLVLESSSKAFNCRTVFGYFGGTYY